MYTIQDLYDLDHTLAKDYLLQFTYPWEALKGIKDFILQLGPTLGEEYEEVSEHVWVGDSILGYYSHMGAGSITSNVKSDKKLVVVHNGTEHIETGVKKFGAMLGDYVEVGCNAVCNPGTVIGRHSNVYPTSCVRGVVPANSIFRNNGEIREKRD